MTNLTAATFQTFIDNAIKETNSNGQYSVLVFVAFDVRKHFGNDEMTKAELMKFFDADINKANKLGREFYAGGEDFYGEYAFYKASVLADLQKDFDRFFAS